MTTQLSEPILERGIRAPHFFNGRLLAAEDLQAEQAARREHDQQLGRAIGSGVVRGLEVRLLSGAATQPAVVVAVKHGAALAPSGQVLVLPDDVEVALVRQEAASTAGSGFSDCSTESLDAVPTGVGVYLLLIYPASGFSERAPMSGLGSGGRITGCGDRYEVEGVRFRLVKVGLQGPGGQPGLPSLSAATLGELNSLLVSTNVPAGINPPPAALSMLRNRLAHLCYGTEQLVDLARDPFALVDGRAALARYGILDDLTAAGRLTADDVPLALVFWTQGGVRIIDMWSVRRRASGVRFVDPSVSDSGPASALDRLPLDALVGERRVREAEALWHQFQDQVAALQADGVPLDDIVAADYFRYLPPAGLLPVQGGGSPDGFDPQTFFGARGSRDVAMLNGDALRSLLQEARYHEPIDLGEPVPEGRPADGRIQLYLGWENTRAVDTAALDQRALVFASGALPYRGTARFSVDPENDPRPAGSPHYATWGRGRFARRVI